MPNALITGASRGFGRASALALASLGWDLVVDGRDPIALDRTVAELRSRGGPGTQVLAVPGDVSDPQHRAVLARVAGPLGSLDLLVNNASALGPMPTLPEYRLDAFAGVLAVNVLAPLGLTQLLLPSLVDARGTVVNLSSDAAVEAYPNWGGYGASKAALDHLSAVLAVECSDVRVYAFDPGDMRTAMHQEAFPGDDISDRPEPETVVPALLRLIGERPPSGRYRASDLLTGAGA
ncbi:SDR family NAD(P)-dependent oxidoreductase [Cryptosporangium sp. NPDC051539]|uniref:SDR family NAD(P)-dependent oxidoreductase n=1 Tax=Cryptosporangium sp. NPDC051539 TaxID=3363962 RepID=UPI0037BD992A